MIFSACALMAVERVKRARPQRCALVVILNLNGGVLIAGLVAPAQDARREDRQMQVNV
jgi:LPS O-antigen subunit length determinant protein (WzzB/FepE family)